MKTDLFQSWGHGCFQNCFHIECSTLTASSFRIWNSLDGILSPPLALSIVMFPKAHLTSHSRTSGSRGVKWFTFTYISFPLWLIREYWIQFLMLYSSRTLLFIHPILSSFHLLIQNSQFIPPTHPNPWQPQVCYLCLWFCFTVKSESYFRFHKWYRLLFAFLCLTYFTYYDNL